MLLRVSVVAALLACMNAATARAAPTVTIDSGPSGPTNEASPTFEFTVENATTVECSVDQGTDDFGPCTTGTSHTEGPLEDGDWTFRVRATDDVPETTMLVRDFRIDTQAPSVALDPLGPTGPTNDPEPSFSWTALGDDASLRTCSLDSGTPSFGACTTPTQYDQDTPLAEGSYTFRIRVEDEAGNLATDSRDFTLDITPPTVTLSGVGPTGPTNDRRPSFGWTTAAGNDRECSVDQGMPDFGPCTSLNQHTQPTALTDGAYTFRVLVTDPAGNIASATRSFSIDTIGPAAAVAGKRRTGNRRPTFQVSSPEPGARLTCRLDGRPRVGCGPTFNTGRKLKPGHHTLRVTAADTLGNPGPLETFRFKILKPPLAAGRAEQTVATALRRHEFANRVVENLQQSCTRRGRFRFSCRFSSAFPGYNLTGRGSVERQRGRISYRFRVRAQGQTLTLTDENEGRFPG